MILSYEVMSPQARIHCRWTGDRRVKIINKNMPVITDEVMT